MSIKVDPEFKALIPPLTPDEYTQLEKNILKDGIRDALIVWPQPDGNDILIDGHNRFEISAAHAGIRFSIRRMEFKDRDEAELWIVRNQKGRRNLSRYDIVTLEDKERGILAGQAKKKLGGDHTSEEFKEASDKKSCQLLTRQEQNRRERANKTDYKIAKAAGVSEDTVRKVRLINEKATEQTKQLVREGKLSINQAYNSVQPKRPDPVKQAREEHEQFTEAKRNGVVDITAIRADRDNQEIIKTALFAEIWKLLNDIDSFGMRHKPEEIAGLYKEVEEDERQLIIDRCDVCRGILSRIQVSLVH